MAGSMWSTSSWSGSDGAGTRTRLRSPAFSLETTSGCEWTVKRIRSDVCERATLRSERRSGESKLFSTTSRWYEQMSEPHSTGSAQCASSKLPCAELYERSSVGEPLSCASAPSSSFSPRRSPIVCTW